MVRDQVSILCYHSCHFLVAGIQGVFLHCREGLTDDGNKQVQHHNSVEKGTKDEEEYQQLGCDGVLEVLKVKATQDDHVSIND